MEVSEPVEGVYEAPFLLHSDTLCRLKLALELEYFLEQPLLAPHLNQVLLPFGCGGLPSAQPVTLQASLPAGAAVLPGETQAQVSGRFDASRVMHGSVEALTIEETIQINPALSAANPLRVTEPVDISASTCSSRRSPSERCSR